MQKLIAAVAIAALAVTLTGCAYSLPTDDTDDTRQSYETDTRTGYDKTFVLSDGRIVTCIHYNGLSCDWEGAE